MCFILFQRIYDVLGPKILNFPPIYQVIYLVIGVETVIQYFCLKTEAVYLFFITDLCRPGKIEPQSLVALIQ